MKTKQFLLVSTTGSIGELNPCLGLGVELRRRGYRVALITTSNNESLVLKSGLDFIGLDGPTDQASPWEQQNPKNDYGGRPRWMAHCEYNTLRPLRQAYEIIAECYEPERTVVASTVGTFAARIAHEKLGVPFATLLTEAQTLRSVWGREILPPLLFSQWVPRFAKRLQLLVADRFVIDPFLGPFVNEFRKELGLAPVRRLMHRWCLSPQRIIGLFPHWYSPRQVDWPSQLVTTGFPIWDGANGEQLTPEVRKIVSNGDRPLVFTSFRATDSEIRRYWRAAVEACEILQSPAILINKFREDLPERLPPGCLHCSYVPFSKLLEHSEAVVHHAGTGTVAHCLAAGIPQVVIPIDFAQPSNAMHVERLGVGQWIKSRRVTGKEIARAVRAVRDNPQTTTRCRTLAAGVHGEHAIDRACDELEAMMGIDAPMTEPSAIAEPLTAMNQV